MNAHYATPATARVVAFFAAAITSAVVLGSTVAGMQPREDLNASLIAQQRTAATSTTVR